MRYARTVTAYHGCDASVAARVLDGEPFKRSENGYDWLGPGVYFWEHGPDRAMLWAREAMARGKVTKPAVVGALVQLGRCFDLFDTEATTSLSDAYPVVRNMWKNLDFPVPKNLGKTPDRLLRHLDCGVISVYLRTLETLAEPRRFDTVRGGFGEGGPAFPGSKILRKMHIQIAVRNPAAIVGVFAPRPLVVGLAA